MGDTHKCANCGDHDSDSDRKENFLDGCSRENLGCENPCGKGPHNSAKCESLPSQISNFTTQFFGEVVKTEVDGKVVWSLPCSLDVGLPANPRGADEGLACYFLRLFMDGIKGLKGDKGNKGDSGNDGANAYTVTLAPFDQPTLSAPTVAVFTSNNPSLSVNGIYVFIDKSGWYQVTGSDGSGTLFLTLVQPLPSAPSTITAGKLVVESGIPGASITGKQGPQGDQGPQGPAGNTTTTNNGVYSANVGTDFLLPVTFTQVDFVNSKPQFTASATGKYLVTVTAVVRGETGIATTDIVALKLKNDSIVADVVGSEQKISGLVAGDFEQVVISVIATTTAPSQTISLYGECGTSNKASVLFDETTLTFVQIA